LVAFPFYKEGAGWVMPALLAGCAGVVLDLRKRVYSIR